jgi:hypothetical protein
MKPKEIEDLLELMLSKAGNDIDQKYLAWQAANNLYRFWSDIDSGVYDDDPMSYNAPSECFGDHMKVWSKLEVMMVDEYYQVEEEWKQYMNELHLPHSSSIVDVEDMPF